MNNATPRKRTLKIYTDGSQGPYASSWGFLVENPDMVLFHGSAPELVNTSTLAEALSILKAMDYLIQKEIKHQFVTIYTDCQPLIKIIPKKGRTAKKQKNTLFGKLVKEIYHLSRQLKENHTFVRIEYTKAHNTSLSQETVFNRMVDYTVRQTMRNSCEIRQAYSWKKKLSKKIIKMFLGSKEEQYWIDTQQWKHLTINKLEGSKAKDLKNRVIRDVQANMKKRDLIQKAS